MPTYIPTAQDIRLLTKHSKKIFCKIDLLDKDFKQIDSLEGITSDGSIDIDADSDVRRTFSATVVLDKNSVITKHYSPDEWINKYVKVYIGFENFDKEISWFSQGIFAFNSNGFRYDSSGSTLSISCTDLVAMLDGTLSGELSGIATKIEQNASIKNAIISTLQLGGFSKYFVDYWDKTVPYDLEYDTGVTIWQMLCELRDLYYPFEMYFDEDTFICKEIPSGYEDPVVLQATVFDELVVDEDTSVDYSEVKNCVEVFGGVIDADYYSSDTTHTNDLLSLNVTNAVFEDDKMFSFIAPVTTTGNIRVGITNRNSADNTTSKIDPLLLYNAEQNTSGEYTLFGSGATAEKQLFSGHYYVIKYDKTNSRFYFIGEEQPHAMVKLVEKVPDDPYQDMVNENCGNIKYVVVTDPDNYSELYKSKFTIENIGRRNKILSGGEYENYYTDEHAMQVCEYENWKSCRLTDSVSVTTLLVPWLDVNQKISYTAKYLGGKEPVEFIIKKISISLNEGTMNLTLSRFYPYYPFIVDIDRI